MVRPQKIRKIGNTSKEAMARAVSLVLAENYSLRSAAENCDVKYQTLARYVRKKMEAENSDEEVRMVPNYSNRQVFTEEQEVMLGEYLNTCSRMAYGLSTLAVRKLAYHFAAGNSLKLPSSWEENSAAGTEWLRSFLKRRNNLSIRRPEPCSLSRLTSFNRHNVELFFNNLKEILRHSILADGSRVYNLDETSTTTVSKSKRIIAVKGVKQISQCSSGEKGVLVTTCAIVSAAGSHIPPAMIFPRKYFKSHMTPGSPPGTLGLANPSGWMTGELFTEVLNHFIKHTSSSKDNPTLIICDNHESHITLNTVNLARNNGVIILTLPPHCSNKMQPLDISVFGPFKSYYYAAIDSWLLRNPGIPITIYQIAQCVGEAYGKAFTPSNIMSGFSKSGIFPFNDNIFTDSDFLSSAVTDRAEHVSRDVTPDREETPDISVSPNTTRELIGEESTSKIKPSASGISCAVTPEGIRGYPKAKARKLTRKPRNKGRSTIITDTPEKELLRKKTEEQAAAKAKRNLAGLETRKPDAAKKQRINKNECADSSESDGEFLADDFSDGELMPEQEDSEHDYNKQGVKDDYVLVKFTENILYVGRLLSDIDADGDYEISYLRKSEKLGGCFIYPKNPDLHSVNQKDIVFVLPPPTKGSTKRLSGLLQFELPVQLHNIR